MTRMRWHHSIRCPAVMAAAAMIGVSATGCSNKYADLTAFVQAHNHDVVASTYRIEPPDAISVSAARVVCPSEPNSTSVTN